MQKWEFDRLDYALTEYSSSNSRCRITGNSTSRVRNQCNYFPFFFFCQLFLCDVWSFVLFLTLNFKFTFIFFSLSVDEVFLSSYPLPVVLLIPVIQLLLCIKAVLWKGWYKVLHLCLTSKSDLFSFQIKMLFINLSSRLTAGCQSQAAFPFLFTNDFPELTNKY